MLAFEILINGQRHCIAGTEKSDVLALTLNWVRDESGPLRFHLGGIVAGKREHFGWNMPTIGVGDVLKVRLLDVEAYDEPDFFHEVAPHPESVKEPPTSQT